IRGPLSIMPRRAKQPSQRLSEVAGINRSSKLGWIVLETAPSIDVPGMEAMHDCTRRWFFDALETPTNIQRRAWPTLAGSKSALLLAPTGSGKTLAAFLAAIDRLMFPTTSLASKAEIRGGTADEPIVATARTKRRSKSISKPGVRVLY